MLSVELLPEGILLHDADDAGGRVLDVLLDGRRLWTFRADESAVEDPRGWLVSWPHDLHLHLDGRSTFAVRERGSEVLLAQTELSFGASDGPVDVRDPAGHLLVLDVAGRLVRTFETQDASALTALMDALEMVLAALARAGVEAFPAYGTLLGAVREGHVLGHDNDVDVGYVSRLTHPADVILESFRLQRALHDEGFGITRYSGAGFKVQVDAGAGVSIGLDVFTGFFYAAPGRPERLVLMGEIFEEFPREAIFPLGTVTLEGRTFPAPADPDRLLTATYGPSWRVPDPTFTYSTDLAIRRRLDTWFRGTRTFRNLWDRRYSTSAVHGPWNRDPHRLAKFVHRREPEGASVVDLGCGRGQDAVWLARRGHRVVGLDFSTNGFHHLARRAEAEHWDVAFHSMNLLETRHVVAWTARLALLPGPRVLVARHLLDATSERGREGIWRLARSVLGREGGRLYLEFMALDPERGEIRYVDELVRELDPATIAAEAVAAGGVVQVHRLIEARDYECPSPPVPGSPEPRKCRMVVEWTP